MGFIDSIKRWRLARKGMSSGKKRRTHGQWTLTGSMDRSVSLRLFLYLLFIIAGCLLVGNNPVCLVRQSATAIFIQMALSVGMVAIFEIQHNNRPRNSRVLIVFGGILLHLISIPFLYLMVGEAAFLILALPYALAPLLSSVLLGKACGVFTSIGIAICGILVVPRDFALHYVVMCLFAGLTVILLTKNVRRRGALLRAGFYAGMVVLVMAVMLDLIEMPGNREVWKLLAIKAGCSIGVSVLVAMIVGGILPLLETVFNITTRISWLELSDLNHKLLRRMQLEAPGTFHHSLVVASLAESAAESIGANAAMCRVCAYFHDIGKLNKPEYFIENQGDVNPHDSITPTMSALVIIAHVKDGVDLAVKHKLNPLIIDVIKEHHGDSLVYYFYHKAKELKRAEEGKVEKGIEKAEDVTELNEKNFRYPGPTPSSKESGIISLADAIESASRTLRKPTPSKIMALVDDITMKRLEDGQLDQCGLTLRELTAVRHSFANTLRSMLHSRIDYPKEDGKGGKGKEPQHPLNLGKVENRSTAMVLPSRAAKKPKTVPLSAAKTEVLK